MEDLTPWPRTTLLEIGMKTVVFGGSLKNSESTARRHSFAASQNGATRTIQQIGVGINCRAGGCR